MKYFFTTLLILSFTFATQAQNERYNLETSFKANLTDQIRVHPLMSSEDTVNNFLFTQKNSHHLFLGETNATFRTVAANKAFESYVGFLKRDNAYTLVFKEISGEKKKVEDTKTRTYKLGLIKCIKEANEIKSEISYKEWQIDNNEQLFDFICYQNELYAITGNRKAQSIHIYQFSEAQDAEKIISFNSSSINSHLFYKPEGNTLFAKYIHHDLAIVDHDEIVNPMTTDRAFKLFLNGKKWYMTFDVSRSDYNNKTFVYDISIDDHTVKQLPVFSNEKLSKKFYSMTSFIIDDKYMQVSKMKDKVQLSIFDLNNQKLLKEYLLEKGTEIEIANNIEQNPSTYLKSSKRLFNSLIKGGPLNLVAMRVGDTYEIQVGNTESYQDHFWFLSHIPYSYMPSPQLRVPTVPPAFGFSALGNPLDWPDLSSVLKKEKTQKIKVLKTVLDTKTLAHIRKDLEEDFNGALKTIRERLTRGDREIFAETCFKRGDKYFYGAILGAGSLNFMVLEVPLNKDALQQ
ncbi:hypothetical protein [Sediminitomix flava]|uniref:Uncharacterized protein n=1 Tax=Sediminitomix flava TaxID=379075 RepID=A0A315ZEE5_SEDFL|nr:hypothetical protein [Sediminitomix flava]PWJ43188.1 hypothetical protein BC781_102737 [Sediminitomix flava]